MLHSYDETTNYHIRANKALRALSRELPSRTEPSSGEVEQWTAGGIESAVIRRSRKALPRLSTTGQALLDSQRLG
jgi:hypothetical protein